MPSVCPTCGSAAGCACNTPQASPCGGCGVAPCLGLRVGAPCPGGDCTTALDPVTGQPVPAPGVCAPGPGNVALTDEELRGSVGTCVQGAVDEARKAIHDLGLRGYRVFLVWQRRDSNQRFQEIRRKELHPVQVSSIAGVGYESSPSGMQPDGDVFLSEISPAQTDTRELLGRVADLDFHLDPDVEFFYEIIPRSRCGEEPAPGRFTPSSLAFYDAENFQLTINLVDQEIPRTTSTDDTADRDGAFQPERDTLRARRGRKRSSLRT